MDYFTLTETNFFRQVAGNTENCDFAEAYKEFVKKVFDLCMECPDRQRLIFTLTYMETELQYFYESDRSGMNGKCGERKLYIFKALSLVHKTTKRLLDEAPRLIPSGRGKNTSGSIPYMWTDTISNFVLMFYGVDEMKSINNGLSNLNGIVAYVGATWNSQL